MMHQTEIIKIAQFDGATEFFLQTDPCSYGNRRAVKKLLTHWLFLNRKLAVARLCKKYGSESYTKHFFRITACRKTFGTITTFLVMVT